MGVLVGAFLFSDTQPRYFLNFADCGGSCLTASELRGLLASVGIQRFGRVLPMIIEETDKSFAIKHPVPQARIHYVVIPKKDIKNIGEISAGDESYLIDSFALLSSLIKQNNLIKYKIITNGPGYQSVAYLHFHLIAN